MKVAARFERVLKDHLSDPDQAAKYLTACYEEGSDVFLRALRDVVAAQGGMTRAARLAGLNRESPTAGFPAVATLALLVLSFDTFQQGTEDEAEWLKAAGPYRDAEIGKAEKLSGDS
jgi:DNA-binding phage protein